MDIARSTYGRAASRLICLLTLVVLAAGCGGSKQTSVVFAESSSSVPGSLPFIAAARGLWKQHGLNVRAVSFSAGRLGFDAMLGGSADISTLAETPLALAAFREHGYVIVAETMQTSKETRIVARRSVGIRTPADLRGRKIAVFLGTQAEYFLSVFLQTAGLSEADVQLVNLQPPDMVSALARGDIDAMVSWEPHVARAAALLGEDAIQFANEGIYTSVFCIATTRKFLAEHPDTVRTFLQGLIEAEAYIHQHPDDAERIVATQVGLDPKLLHTFYGEYDFRVQLSSKLIRILEDIGKWAQRSGKVPAGAPLPDYADTVAPGVLRSIDPTRVTL